MEIVAGIAGGTVLLSPPEDAEVRPTSVRARRSFFDSLGDLDGLVFADLCSGSGAMGLEAASRGASRVLFFEKSIRILNLTKRNSNLVSSHGVHSEFSFVRAELPGTGNPFPAGILPNVIFADPPYDVSMDLLAGLTSHAGFTEWAKNAVVWWELPDRNYSLPMPSSPWRILELKNFGGAVFLKMKAFFE